MELNLKLCKKKIGTRLKITLERRYYVINELMFLKMLLIFFCIQKKILNVLFPTAIFSHEIIFRKKIEITQLRVTYDKK